jgi:membrane-associated phospholipid phosphatase
MKMKNNAMSPLRHALWIFPLCAAALVVFFFTDLTIAGAVYDRDTFYGWFFDVLAPSVAPVIGMVLLCCLRVSDVERTTHPVLVAVEWVLAAACAYLSADQFDKYAETHMPMWVLLVFALGQFAAAMIIALLAKPDRAALQKLTLQAVCMILVVFVSIVIVKGIWGRQRYFTMTDPMTQFTPWLFPQFRSGSMYASFPSGHTGNGSAILLLTLFPAAFPRMKKLQNLLYVFVGLWIPLLAFSRMVEGAHFASDVTAGFVIAFAMFCVVNAEWFRKGTEKFAAKL